MLTIQCIKEIAPKQIRKNKHYISSGIVLNQIVTSDDAEVQDTKHEANANQVVSPM